MRPSDFSIIHLENEFSFMYDIPGLFVSQALGVLIVLISPFR